jgi:hypothetical protein
MTKPTAALLLLLASLATPASAQVVRGKVLDAATGDPVPQAEVTATTVEGRGAGRTRAGTDGSFTLDLRAPGTIRLRAERSGYRPTLTDTLPVDARETLEVELRLSATAVAIEPLRVTARLAPPRRRSLEMAGVYERERDGFGRRLFREDLERQSNMNLAQILVRVQGTTRIQHGPYEYIYFTRSMQTGTQMPAPGPGRMAPGPAALREPRANTPGQQDPGKFCLPLLYIDGTVAAYGPRNDINSLVRPEQIEAIELYSSAANIPAQYSGSSSACGVILIWTRSEP